MKHRTNRDMVKLNLFSIAILLLSLALAYLIWTGVFKELDKPLGIVRNTSTDTWWIKAALLIATAGVLELFFHYVKRIAWILRKLFSKDILYHS